jgi:hypothetical protein
VAGVETPRRWLCVLVFCAAAPKVAGCEPDEDEQFGTTLDAGSVQCERDEQSHPEDAVSITAGEEHEGFICPRGDRDWYGIEIPAGETILNVSLQMAISLSPVELTYAVFSVDGEGNADEIVATPQATAVGLELDELHCLDEGEHLLVVRAVGDNSADARNAYTTSFSTQTDADTHEPNNDTDAATTLGAQDTATGYISCPGDRDFYAIDVPAGDLFRVELTSEVADYEPTLKVIDEDGQTLVHQINRSGRVQPTELARFVSPPEPGRYYISVSDDDDLDSDPDIPYELSVEVVTDNDPNEPNNSADMATELSSSAVSCGGSWSSWFEASGTIGAPGDNDWFALPVDGCQGGILEAHMAFDTNGMSDAEKWEFNAKVQASVAMVVPEPNSPCNEHSECNALQKTCSNALDCAGYFEQCLPEGLCAGASVCLPSGACGANRVHRYYECDSRLDECQAQNSPAPPPNEARLAAPLPQGTPAYLRVSDFQSDAAAPDVPYRLRVRVRDEPDANEPNNVFTNEIERDMPVSAHVAEAPSVPVYDCTGADPTCCSSEAWTTGYISYENDLDWFTYEHPCPGEDCLLRFHYEVDAGPVDTIMNVYRGSGIWYGLLEAEQQEVQSSKSGYVGGTESSDRCFYGFQGHSDPYRLLVRDIRELHSDGLTPMASSRDWDADQSYSFCIEKVLNSCDTPCVLSDNGECDTP